MQIARRQTPEQRELENKLGELCALQRDLVERELELATLRAELAAFESKYLATVGQRYAELDEIEAQIAEAEARLNPVDDSLKGRAQEWRQKAEQSARATTLDQEPAKEGRFAPSDELKRLYREVAKAVHPDLAGDEQERTRRHRFMAEANQAYENGDEGRLRAILGEWESAPESVKGDGVAADLVRTLRKIAFTQERLRAIAAEIAELKSTDLFRLKVKAEAANDEGHDLLAVMVCDIDSKIEDARRRLSDLASRG
ncbi:MAG: molecular chaperone DnaJ [Candidatus Hydrogenedentes bacterium]|nr:molecular chaperone DnaJ [Candidatus Hydrogenedentota bacterium]